MLCLCQAAQGLLLRGDHLGSSCLSHGLEALDGYNSACVPGRYCDPHVGDGLYPRGGLFPQVTVRALTPGAPGQPFIRVSHP